MPGVTGVWCALPQDSLNERHHFMTQYTDATYTQPVTVRDPLTGADTGQTARQLIEAQAATFGWPLYGLYISGSGSGPHFVLHRGQFPTQTGNPEARTEKLQTALNTALENIYKVAPITDPDDPDVGKEQRFFWAVMHLWAYRNDGAYTDRRNVNSLWTGELAMVVSNEPPGNWWQELQ